MIMLDRRLPVKRRTATLDLSPAERQELAQLNLRVHGPREARDDPASRLVFGGYDDTVCVVRVRLDSLLVSCLFVAERRTLVDGRPTPVGGIRGVVTHPDCRRRGFAHAAMQRGQRAIWQDLRPDLALLLSSEMAVP